MLWTRNLAFIAIGLFALAATLGRLLPSDMEVPDVAWSPALYEDNGFVETLGAVDSAFRDSWHTADVGPAPLVDEWTLYRRISLGLMGTIPSLEDIRSLESIPEDDRLHWWVERTLSDRRFSDYVAERLARSYVGTEEGPFLVFRRRRFVTWLSDQIASSRPYDQIAQELIAGTGIWTDSPAVNFLTVTNDVNGDDQPDEERLAARTARAFLGIRLDCVQCHDDNLGGDWQQRDFQQLAAFYADASSSLLGITDHSKDYEFTYLGEEQPETVPACVPFLPEIHASDQGTRRQQLAEWTTHPDNRPFARAMVNRVWALLFGEPMVSPIDDLPLDGPFPAGMETLSTDFIENGHDMRRLIRLIVSTKAFQLSSRSPDGVTDRQEQVWAAYPITRLRPEQVAGSVLQSSSLATVDAESHILLRFAKYEEQQKFVRRYGDTGEDEYVDRVGTIPQRLLMMNGTLIRERTKDDLVRNAVTRIASLVDDNERAIDSIYWTVLTRRPSSTERTYFLKRIGETSGSGRRRVLEDLAWTLFNSTEFQVNH